MSLSRPSRFTVALGIAALLFLLPLAHWAIYAWNSGGGSYVLTVPVVVAYLVRLRWKEGAIAAAPSPFSSLPSLLCLLPIAGGAIALALWWFIPVTGRSNWHIMLPTLVFVLSVVGVGGWRFGWLILWRLQFPVVFLFLMVPVPTPVMDWFEVLLQHASAEVTHLLFVVAGIPFSREGMSFILPTITLEVAKECSGARSTLVLFGTGLLGGYLFLRRPWKRWLLAMVALLLGILRNGFRILLIGWLCVKVGPHMVHGPVHNRSATAFFALSLVPLLLLLVWLRRGERAARDKEPEDGGRKTEDGGRRTEDGGCIDPESQIDNP